VKGGDEARERLAAGLEEPTSRRESGAVRRPDLSSSERTVAILRATLEATADGILVIGASGEVLTYNDRFLQLWRIPRELAEKTDNDGLLTFVRNQLVNPESFLRLVDENGRDPENEYFGKLHFQDGRVYERCSRPQRIGPVIVGRVISFRDVTEREQLLEQAQTALKQRDEFLALAAHEIRSPITSMWLAVQRLRHHSLPLEDRANVLEVVEREQKRLIALVDDLLDVGKIRTGQFPPMQLDAVDLSETVRVVAERFREELEDTRTPIALNVDDAVVGCWDGRRLDQVVSNLLGNAVKFGKGKPIAIRTFVRDGWAELTVQDHGIGIPKGTHELLFNRFERGVTARQFAGLGLGLHIAKTIVTAFGGTIDVESELGHGATFVVRLPLEPPRST
jgi:signal transduction histidine kinase